MRIDADFTELKQRLQTIEDLSDAQKVLVWDQATYMPPGGGEARGRQLALLSSMAHESLTDPAVGRLLDSVTPWAEAQGADSDEAALVRVARRDYDRATRVPSSFVHRLAEHTAATYNAWQRARPGNDFAAVRAPLEKTVALSREFAGFHEGRSHSCDPLIDHAEEGMDVATVRKLFGELRPGLVALLAAIRARPEPDDRCLRGDFPEAAQRAFGEMVVRAFGYDFQRGRNDKTAHPFMIKLGRGDVRITGRYRTDSLCDGLFSMLHESGHAMYEQGIDERLDGTPLYHGTTWGVHESQSRLWENLVGRSLPFWRHWFTPLKSAFPRVLDGIELGTFHRAINKVEPSLIRTDADEVTYNLHVMLRFDLELEMLEGKLAVADLPEAWRSRMKADLGIAPSDDRDGALQDMHWYTSMVGGQFQSYTLGNIMSAQFFAAARRDLSDLDAQMEAGEFGALRRWLIEKIYRHGRKLTADEIVRRATGAPLSIEPYVNYLDAKYRALYGLA
ncbi:MAG TPA: carboxypeptidase M32 [Casimicrobiaceae bacterium]|nr:carboxypeptidase M32 [Casimicrobiaceae bacterium]